MPVVGGRLIPLRFFLLTATSAWMIPLQHVYAEELVRLFHVAEPFGFKVSGRLSSLRSDLQTPICRRAFARRIKSIAGRWFGSGGRKIAPSGSRNVSTPRARFKPSNM